MSSEVPLNWENTAASLESFSAQASEAAALALHGQNGRTTWNIFLSALGVSMMQPSDRAAAIALGGSGIKGAPPFELRQALNSIRKKLKLIDTPETDEVIDSTIRGYVAKARPQTSLGSIFANAQATTLRYSTVKDGVTTKKCSCCGAARPEGTELSVCAYCGQDQFLKLTSR